MAALFPQIFAQFFDANGDPLNAGTVTFYATGTTNKLDTYTDQEQSAINQNPLTLDSAGRATFFGGPTPYDIVLKDSAGNTIKTLTNISTGANGGSLAAVNTLTTLRGLAAGAFDYVLLGGGTAQGDGGSYFYYWDASSTAADDGLNVIEPGSSPDAGRWILLSQNHDTFSSFTITLTGCTTTITGTAYYVRKGNLVLLLIPKMTGTSNTTACTLTGIPAAIRPGTRLHQIPIPIVRENSGYYTGSLVVQTDGSISVLFKADATSNFSGTFTNSGIKGVGADDFAGNFAITYMLNANV